MTDTKVELEAFIEQAKRTAATMFDTDADGTSMPSGLMQYEDGSMALLALDVPLAQIGEGYINTALKSGKHPLFGSYAVEAWFIPYELRKDGDELLDWSKDPRGIEVYTLSIRAFELRRWFQAIVTTKDGVRSLGEWRELDRGDDVLRWGPFSLKVVRKERS